MPASSICVEPGCPTIATRQGRCGQHQRAPRPGRGSTRRWRTLRAKILRRDHGLCRYCGRPANTVDHIIPVLKAPHLEYAEHNLVAACSRCNARKGTKG